MQKVTIRRIINNWYNVSVLLAVVSAFVAVFVVADIVQRLLWVSIAILFLHFFEEFGFPGGFPLMGVKVLLGSREMNSEKWDCNNLNSMFGNWGFLFFIYALPLILSDVKFLTLAAMMFSILELIMHAILFNVKQKTIYNPGAVTAIFGLAPIAIYYFATVFDKNFFVWSDYLAAVAWSVFIFWFSFRSPLYWSLGRLKGYKLTRRTAYGINFVAGVGKK